MPVRSTTTNTAAAAAATNTPGSSFSQTLQFITALKLQELDKQRRLYHAHARVVDDARALRSEGDVLKQVALLAKAVREWKGTGALGWEQTVGGRLTLRDLEFWLQQARTDPSFSRDTATRWAETLEAHIGHTATRFDAAALFGKLFNEWLASGDSVALAYQAGPADEDQAAVALSADADADADADYVEVGRKEMYEQKEKLLSIVFDEPNVDVTQLTQYMKGLFESDEAAKRLDQLRRDLKRFGSSLQQATITTDNVENAIAGLLASGLMDEDKRSTLKTFQENFTALQEVASVLTMRMASLDSWEWPKEGILVEFRRHLNGKYRAFTDPEIVDALLLHHIGVAWQVKFKAVLRDVFDSQAWVRPPPPSPIVKENRIAQLRGNGRFSIDSQREKTRRNIFFLTQLQDKASVSKPYDDLVDMVRDENDDDDEDGDTLNDPAVIKQKLLQIMTTECYLNTSLHGTYAALCSDLEWFGPSLPHTSILTVFEFLGVSKTWLQFFKAFLSMPIRFPGDPETRVRKRGTPISYSLSVLCGEIVVFIMDFAVNQRANGLYLYRMHDDLWLWDADVKKVAAGWTEMQKYAALVGLTFNQKKTGSAYIGPRNDANTTALSALPAGDIRWGFLKFDPERKRFRLDQAQVNEHIGEMRRQLASTKSVFGWVNAYNKYMAFFFRNFGGTPARCFNPAHAVEMVDTLARIQQELFPGCAMNPTGGAVGHLRWILDEHFGAQNLPEGYFYFPISNGGLELRNPLLEILALERRLKPLVGSGIEDAVNGSDSGEWVSLSKDTKLGVDNGDANSYDCSTTLDSHFVVEEDYLAEQKFPKRIEYDQNAYRRSKELWGESKDKLRLRYSCFLPDEKFMSFAEYTALRESWLPNWGESYRDMLSSLGHREATLVPEIEVLVDQLPKPWDKMDWYEKWVVSMYGEDVIHKYGGLKAVHPDLIPVGMVELFKTSRMKLDQ